MRIHILICDKDDILFVFYFSGILCAAKLNGEWQRARVESVDNGKVQVLLIDQGYTPICTEFRQLPSDLASIPPLSRKYSLKLPESVEEWSPAATSAFSEYSGTCFSLEILEEAEVPVIRLVHQGEDVVEILTPLCKKVSEGSTTGSSDSKEEFKPAEVEVTTAESDPDTEESRQKKELLEKEKQTLESPESSFHSAEENSPEKESELTNGVDVTTEKMTCPDDQVRKIPSVEKIVPGSISRGLSETEIIRDSIERCREVPPEDKIVPGSISRGDDDLPDSESESSNKSEPITKTTQSVAETSQPISPKIVYDDRIVAGAVSSGESPAATSRPVTPKTPHSEKIVAGVVSLPEHFLEAEVDEVLEVHVDEQHS